MSQNYLQIRNDYLRQAWARSPEVLSACLPAELTAAGLRFQAFGAECLLTAAEITLAGAAATGPEGLLIALYASSVPDLPVELDSLKSFKELPNSMPYQGAFAANAEHILVPQVPAIHRQQERLAAAFSGRINPRSPSGDFSFTLYPLPRVPLYYIFHLPDEEFPASVTCLFAANAPDFMPLDGLADVAEYTGKKIISLRGRRISALQAKPVPQQSKMGGQAGLSPLHQITFTGPARYYFSVSRAWASSSAISQTLTVSSFSRAFRPSSNMMVQKGQETAMISGSRARA